MSRSLPVRSPLRHGAIATALLACTVALSACGAGHNAATSQVKSNSQAVSVHGLHVDNLMLVVDDKVPNTAALTTTIANDGTKDTLTSVSIAGVDAPVKLSEPQGQKNGQQGEQNKSQAAGAQGDSQGGSHGEVTIPTNGSQRFGGEGNASALVRTSALKNDTQHKVTLHFAKAGSATAAVRVTKAEGDLASAGPSGKPTPSASRSEKAGSADSTDSKKAGPDKGRDRASQSASGSAAQDEQSAQSDAPKSTQAAR